MEDATDRRNPGNSGKRLTEFIEYRSPGDLKANPRNARRHPAKQLKLLKRSIERFGFLMPILIDADGVIVAGHARLEAARQSGLNEVPTICINHLTRAEIEAYTIADNRLAELAEWDRELLAAGLQELIEMEFEVEFTGFDLPEIDWLIGEHLDQSAEEPDDPSTIPPLQTAAISQPGEIWVLADHKLLCDDATDPRCYKRLLGNTKAQMVLTDPPYNVTINGNVCGLGGIKHREFAMASGEMSLDEFGAFLNGVISNLCRFSHNGSVHYIFMDWRHLVQLAAICGRHYDAQLNLCVWAKTNGGMGSLYRSQHELVLVHRNGEKPHINNIQLGKYKRNRSNVWRYEGVNTINPNQRGDLALHPTVKPVPLLVDAIKDCSHRRGLILDPFVGSGSTIVAAEITGRRARAIELDPLYVDVAIRRWQAHTGGKAVRSDGVTFDTLEAEGRD